MAPNASRTAQASRYGRWWDRYREVAAFHSVTGKLPDSSNGSSGANLRKWIDTQCTNYQAGKLDELQIAALQKIEGITDPGPLKNRQDDAWAVHFAELKDWYATHDRLPRRAAPPGPERSLADFVCNQRRVAGQGRLKEERRRMLSTIPGVLKTFTYAEARQAAWESRVADLRTWHSEHGRMPRQNGTATEHKLACFLATQRSLAAKGQLLEARRQILSTIPAALFGADDQGLRQAQWDAKFSELQDWHAEHGSLPKAKKSSGPELALAKFVIRQRRAKASGKLSDRRREKLESIPGIITPVPKALPEWRHQHWNDRLEAFTRWIEAGNVVPASITQVDDHIAAWALKQLNKIDSGLMPPDRRARFLQAAQPRRLKAERSAKKPITTNLPESLLDEAKAIVAANDAHPAGYRSLAEFVELAVLAEVQRAQIALNDGLPYSGGEAAAIPLRVGRPLAA